MATHSAASAVEPIGVMNGTVGADVERHEYKSLLASNPDTFNPAEFLAATKARTANICDGAAVELSVQRLSLVAGGAHNMYTVVLKTGTHSCDGGDAFVAGVVTKPGVIPHRTAFSCSHWSRRTTGTQPCCISL